MTDERYVARTERLADAQAAHAPVWRSRYDGPYTGLDNDPDPAFAQYAPLLIAAHGGDGVGIWQGGAGLSAALHAAWGAFATTGDPGWAPYTSARPAGDDLRPGRPARRGRPVRPRPRRLVRPELAARPVVGNRRAHLTTRRSARKTWVPGMPAPAMPTRLRRLSSRYGVASCCYLRLAAVGARRRTARVDRRPSMSA